MNRKNLLAAGLAAVVAGAPALLLANPTDAIAQGAPPEIPMVVYGDATGATAGQRIVALVAGPSGSTTCGTGTVINEGGSPKYVVQVAGNGQKAGCGRPGATVSFYLTPSASSGGRLANQTTTWNSAQIKQLNLTFGNALTPRAYAPQAAKDGVR